jgi:hypothetical protein
MATPSIPDIVPKIASLLWYRYKKDQLPEIRSAVIQTAVQLRQDPAASRCVKHTIQNLAFNLKLEIDPKEAKKALTKARFQEIHDLIDALVRDHITAPNGNFPMGVYKHFKGPTYTFLMEAMHTETEERMLVYVSHETGKTCVRPIRMFSEVVRWPDGKYRSRWVLKEKLVKKL